MTETTNIELRTVQVDFTGLMEVVGRNLYSTPIVAVRELVQNAHDSCVRRRLEQGEDGYAPWIVIRVNGGVLEIEDNGSGLTHQEILDYLATIGSGYTRKLRETHDAEGLIGAFGLGFLSAYVLSDKVEVLTTSVSAPHERWRFVSHTGERFSVTPIEPTGGVGTLVRLTLNEAHQSLGELERLDEVLRMYCGLLPVPIVLEGVGRINEGPPPWKLDAAEVGALNARAKRMDFATLYGRFFEPLATIDVPPSADGVVRGGLLWIQDGGSYSTSDNRDVSVFVRGMLVSRDERNLLPVWAGFIGGVVDAYSLTPTASRETLVQDEAHDSARQHLCLSLVEGLERLSRREPAAWRRILRRHNEALLGAAISDPRLFSLVATQLTVPTSEGDLTVSKVARGGRAVHISVIEKRGPDEILFRALQTPIVDGTRYAAYPFVRQYCEHNGLALIEMGTREGDERMFPAGSLDVESQARLETLFARPRIKLVPTHFQPSALSLVLAYNQEVKLKQRIEDDRADERMTKAVLGLARHFTRTIDADQEARLYVNLDAPIIAALLDPARAVDAPAVRAAATILWGMARLMTPSANSDDKLEDTLAACGEQLSVLLG